MNAQALRSALSAINVSTRDFARALSKGPVKWSLTTVHRLMHGKYPARCHRDLVDAELRRALIELTFEAGGAAPLLQAVFAEAAGDAENEEGRSRSNDTAPDATPDIDAAASAGHSLNEKEQQMLIQKCALTPAARECWRLFGAALSAPWQREQVFLGGEMLTVYEHMLAKARFGGLLAVVGESGCGKSTLKDVLVGDLAAEGDVVVIEPHTQRMEENDTAGKSLKGADIVTAIMAEIAPTERVCCTAEAQLNQVARALAASQAESRDRRHLLIIDEAHCLPKPTLRHLKRFLELKDSAKKGLQRPMLSLILLGQPELAVRLSPHDQTVREVWQRCEVVHLRPLGSALEKYVRHRLGDAVSAFTPPALVKFAECLTDRHGVSYQYPLAVDSWLAEILNTTAGLAPSIDAAQVEEVFAAVRRRQIVGGAK